jgi:HEPN domain-containing protein
MTQHICDVCGSQHNSLDGKKKPDDIYHVIISRRIPTVNPRRYEDKRTNKQVATRDICVECAERIFKIKAEDK